MHICKKIVMYSFFFVGVLCSWQLVYAQETPPDTTPPVISDVVTSLVSANGITIEWMTDEPVIHTFEYGTSQSYGSNASMSENLSTSGTAVLTGLLSDTTYYYCIHVTDASSNTSNSCDSFITPPVPDTTGSIISGVANELLLSTSTKIVWITDEPAYSKLRYGTTESLGSETTLETTPALLHETALIVLTPNTKYYFCIDATDTAGNKSDSCGHTFTTAMQVVVQDIDPPVVSSLAVQSITTSSAKITWMTNESAKAQVQYGLTVNYGSTSRLSRSFGLYHSVNLSRLKPATLYHYRVKSVDRAGNVYLSPDETFTTLALPLPTPPSVVPPPPDPSFVDGASESGAVRVERIRGYRNQSSESAQKINALGSTPVYSVPIPILFGIVLKNLYPSFGDPRSGGRTHEGNDIIAVKGTPVVSPTAAVVIRIGVGPTEGNYVYTANPGGETFVYMHLDRIGENVTEGQVLETGSLIGYVGNTGNASGGPAHLHFEIHTNRTPVDPFPRLTREFTLAEKISYLNKILTQTSNSASLAQFLVLNFRSTFTAAATSGILMPPIISNYLSLTENVPATRTGGLPSGDLANGSSGIEVKNLQLFLISKASGPAAARLATAGATGIFGSITKAALVEYQRAVGLSPDGYYGPITRARVLAATGGISTPPLSSTAPTGILAIARTLRVGSLGNDVKLLQTALGVFADGSFGPKTKAAVVAFQISKGLTADGVFGPMSRVALAGSGSGGALPLGCTNSTAYSITTGIKCR